ncbi:DUF2913 family protein [Vibrio algarum]|uniref:DUF2913 family protein n=1 Tax=Vibrio algarum TaxID=3020714 RepID=A0ABT4YNG8_9VIBR|nr:DUF2913 family protein [Vibrio sp. KJ40-1]MDB1122698.1 DUF2913 family protein [Vibrio sp. KJ40-1]
MKNSNLHSDQDALFFDVVCHTMLNLYMEIAYSKRYIPPNKRSQILLKYLKHAMKRSGYKSVKNDIRGLIYFGRKNDLGFEAKLIEIQNLSERHPVNDSSSSDLSNFTQLLKALDSICSVSEEPLNVNELVLRQKLYLNQQNLVNAFNEKGQLISKIEVVLPEVNWEEAVRECRAHNWQLIKVNTYQKNHVVGLISL